MEVEARPPSNKPKIPPFFPCNLSLMEKRHILFFPAMLAGSFILYIAFFSPSWPSFSSSASSYSELTVKSKLNKILIAEQRSLALLDQQARELLHISDSLASNSSSTGHEQAFLKSQIDSQIRLNREIQGVRTEYFLISFTFGLIRECDISIVEIWDF